MSEPLRIAVVAEGCTDLEILKPVIEAMLKGKSFILTPLQPETSAAFVNDGNAGKLGGGWVGVCRWCVQSSKLTNGNVQNDPLFWANDLLIIHLGADVAHKQPQDAPRELELTLIGRIPCNSPCPPVEASIIPLRAAIQHWLDQAQLSNKVVMCIPSKSMDAWVVAILFPRDRTAKRSNWECNLNPESRLAQQPRPNRIAKGVNDYRKKSEELRLGWPGIATRLSSAARFQSDFLRAIKVLTNPPQSIP